METSFTKEVPSVNDRFETMDKKIGMQAVTIKELENEVSR